ncbi:hypothetical protein M885DRAFT_501550 [Pelagophyceae sp. CCMP2097]|nr:hypothetical protein M885DRAFT_501550 [Pelagophyceae sp. CCMP2097]
MPLPVMACRVLPLLAFARGFGTTTLPGVQEGAAVEAHVTIDYQFLTEGIEYHAPTNRVFLGGYDPAVQPQPFVLAFPNSPAALSAGDLALFGPFLGFSVYSGDGINFLANKRNLVAVGLHSIIYEVRFSEDYKSAEVVRTFDDVGAIYDTTLAVAGDDILFIDAAGFVVGPKTVRISRGHYELSLPLSYYDKSLHFHCVIILIQCVYKTV